jgi:hypothetical protein
VQTRKALVQLVIDNLGITKNINNVVIEGTDSPWLEKALIKRKKGSLDVKTFLWTDDSFLYGRIYRIFLYIADVLDPAFLYDPLITPDEEKEPAVRDRYNQIWSLYVDSRMERLGIESFFDMRLRKNLFIDLEKGLGWKDAGEIFDMLWSRQSFTYPEIVDLSYHLEERLCDPKKQGGNAIEQILQQCLHNPTVGKHLDRLNSPRLWQILNDLLSFSAYSCRDGMITPCHYGIIFLYQNKVFFELIPSQQGLVIMTMLDPRTEKYDTFEITEHTHVDEIQKKIRDRYDKLSMHDRN